MLLLARLPNLCASHFKRLQLGSYSHDLTDSLLLFRSIPMLPQACRNYAKAVAAAREQGLADGSYTVMHLDLASLDSVRQVPRSAASGSPH